ncbi:threonine/serine exporter family protein [Agaribacter flavus]|uniref:Threonine/serine exporter ThrE family protein n=1 Tax=Agaribacter flavus TaxID=1902781 RepID=A0ABV7FK50_9ALTE
MDKTEFTQIRRFIVKLGKMLHKYGTPAFRLEAYLMEVAEYFGVNASFISAPTSLTFVIWSDRHEEEYTHAARMTPGELDLNSLALTDELAVRLLAGKISIEDADKRLDEIDALKSPYGRFVTGLAFTTSTAAFATLMGAGVREIVISGILGLVVYLWTIWSEKSKRVKLMLEPVASFSTAFLAGLISHFVLPGINIWLIILSSLIILVPGLALSIGLAELSTRNLVSGTARVMDAIMQLFKLYFGAFLGIYLSVALLAEYTVEQPEAMPGWVQWLAVIVLSLGLVAIFRTQLRDLPWAVLATVVAYASTKMSSMYLEQGLGAFVGAFVLGVYANVFARVANKPSSIISMHGLIVLVPGSKTYIGLNSMISGQDFIQADHVGQETFLILMSLVAGLIFANVVAPTKKAL